MDFFKLCHSFAGTLSAPIEPRFCYGTFKEKWEVCVWDCLNRVNESHEKGGRIKKDNV